MQFNIAALIVLALGAPQVLAATCFPQSGCKHCASFQQLEDLKNNFCATKSNLANPPRQQNGDSTITVTGPATGSECGPAFDNIVDDCFGNFDGGDFNFDGWDMRLSFCNCEQ